MKGIILSGGQGTRLHPLTKITSKQLLPVYDRPMIFYPLQTLLDAGIKEIMIIVAPERAGDYLNLLGSGSKYGARFTYEVQEKPLGLAQAFHIADYFIGDDDVALILGDNIFADDLSEHIKSFKGGARIFAKEVPDPHRFGVVKFNKSGKAEKIVEKPKELISNYAITGLYLYDKNVVSAAKGLKPSERGELEIVDLHNWYLQRGELDVVVIDGEWIDAGTYDSLFKANELMYNRAKNGKQKSL
jgi:glucose-1-phosphate thymidylyltransferase